MGGYAGSHHDAVLRLEERKLARLVCTCDPQPDTFLAQQSAWRFRERGVYVFSDYSSMLAACAKHLDLLVVPTPVHLHAEIHKAAIDAGLAVYLEKPPTLDYAELEEMIERDRRATKASLVGFNFIIEPPRQVLKRRILDGEFGLLREVRLHAMWSRPTSYFRRCPYAGRLFVGDRLVLDSCLSNEFAHFAHNALFWAGSASVASWPQLTSVKAELYRAHVIESADTICAEARTENDVTVRLALSLAHAGPCSHAETVVCENATIEYIVGQGAQIRWASGKLERIAWEPFDPLLQNHLAYLRYLTDETPRPATTLADCRAFVILNALAFVSSGTIAAIPAEQVSLVFNSKEQKDYVSVAGLDGVMDEFAKQARWPSANGWSRASPPARATPAELTRLQERLRPLATPLPA